MGKTVDPKLIDQMIIAVENWAWTQIVVQFVLLFCLSIVLCPLFWLYPSPLPFFSSSSHYLFCISCNSADSPQEFYLGCPYLAFVLLVCYPVFISVRQGTSCHCVVYSHFRSLFDVFIRLSSIFLCMSLFLFLPQLFLCLSLY